MSQLSESIDTGESSVVEWNLLGVKVSERWWGLVRKLDCCIVSADALLLQVSWSTRNAEGSGKSCSMWWWGFCCWGSSFR